MITHTTQKQLTTTTVNTVIMMFTATAKTATETIGAKMDATAEYQYIVILTNPIQYSSKIQRKNQNSI